MSSGIDFTTLTQRNVLQLTHDTANCKEATSTTSSYMASFKALQFQASYMAPNLQKMRQKSAHCERQSPLGMRMRL